MINKKTILRVFILLFAVIFIFYSFLFWKLSRTSNPLISAPKNSLKILFTWNPAEIVQSINNRWDSLYLTDKTVKPFVDFSELKNQLENIAGGDIIFSGISSSITLDKNGDGIVNEGSYLIKQKGEYFSYDFYIYKTETKAHYSYDLDHSVGLIIYRKPQKVEAKIAEEYKSFTEAAIKAQKRINIKDLKNDLKIESNFIVSLSRFMKINTIQISIPTSSKFGFTKPIKTIIFDDNGELTKN